MLPTDEFSARFIGEMAVASLRLEVKTWPKPGLVSEMDSGSHVDMNAHTFYASAQVLSPYFGAFAEAGAAGATMARLRGIGLAAERATLAVTGGVNTHRGAIFCLGLLCAAAGALALSADQKRLSAGSLGQFVRRRWGQSILADARCEQSHGAMSCCRYGVGGARSEGAHGFPHVYQVGLPALQRARSLAGSDENAARVQACFALIAHLPDTNLLYRGGFDGWRFARSSAQQFMEQGGIGQPRWIEHAQKIHGDFVDRGLSPGGSADLLAASWLIGNLEEPSETVARFAIVRNKEAADFRIQ